MTSRKLSLNKACFILAAIILLISVIMLSALYVLTEKISVICCGIVFVFLMLLCVATFVAIIRRKLTLFSDMLCDTLDDMRSCRKVKIVLPVNELICRN